MRKLPRDSHDVRAASKGFLTGGNGVTQPGRRRGFMFEAILSVRSLLLAIFILMAGSGFLATLISLRLEASGAASVQIGVVATAYFAGLTLGALKVAGVIQRVGHIRAFAAFVSVFSASTLTYAVYENVLVWTVLRFVDGLCMAGVFVCIESWLNERSDTRTRGSILAFYMISLYAGQAIGQFLLNLSDEKPSMPFMASSILLSIAVVPIVLTRIAGPAPTQTLPLGVRRLYEASPLGVVGAVVTGLMLGAFYGLGAVYVRRLGLDTAATALFMSIVILGGIALQWPLGRLSDLFDRRRVITGAFAGALAVSIAVSAAPAGIPLFILGALFGGLTFALYPLCVAHTNDRLGSDERVQASGGLVLAYSAGAAAGPLASAGVITVFDQAGLFLFIAFCAAGALAFAIWREGTTMPVPGDLQQPYQVLPRTTPVSASLDPLAVEEK